MEPSSQLCETDEKKDEVASDDDAAEWADTEDDGESMAFEDVCLRVAMDFRRNSATKSRLAAASKKPATNRRLQSSDENESRNLDSVGGRGVESGGWRPVCSGGSGAGGQSVCARWMGRRVR